MAQYLQLLPLRQDELLGVLLSQQLRRFARLDMTKGPRTGGVGVRRLA